VEAACRQHTGVTAVLFWADWHPASVQMCAVCEAMSRQFPQTRFLKVNVDEASGGVGAAFGFEEVPFFTLLNPSAVKIDSIAGADPPKMLEKVKTNQGISFPLPDPAAAPAGGAGDENAADGAEGDVALNAKLKELIEFSPVMMFMKGSKDAPFCKFSKQAVAILNKNQVEYSTFDILQDNEVREGLKVYSNWKTYPQLYVNGELVGGIDIVKEMDEDGSLVESIPKECLPKEEGADDAAEGGEKPLEERLKALTSRSKVMLFMKGDPDQPRCGFSNTIVQLLKDEGVQFDSFDILQDEEVRQGLKTFSNWNTYPQLYANGSLIGGLDIVKELVEEGNLMEEIENA